MGDDASVAGWWVKVSVAPRHQEMHYIDVLESDIDHKLSCQLRGACTSSLWYAVVNVDCRPLSVPSFPPSMQYRFEDNLSRPHLVSTSIRNV